MAPVILRDTDGDLISSAAPAGSTSYYCIRFAPASLRDHLMAVNAWRTLIRGTLAQVSDAGVATRKLAWWHDELDRIIAHRGTHPLAGPLGSAIAFASLPREPFIDILWAAEALIVNRKISDFSALLGWARQDLGALCELDARIQGKQGSKPLDLARTAGAYSSLVELIRDSGWLTRRGHTRFLPTLAAIPSAMGDRKSVV